MLRKCKLQWAELRKIEEQKLEELEREQPEEKRPAKTGLLEVQFDGILQVTDPAAFHTALQAGMWRHGLRFLRALTDLHPADVPTVQ